MTARSVLIAAVAFCVSAGLAHADVPASAEGFWVTQDHGGVVSIVPCDSGLCGVIVGTRTDHPPDALVTDVHNPNPAKRKEPICGLTLMGGLKAVKSNAVKWEGGWVYDPESGNTYKAEMQLNGANVLKLRGYMGISLFGRTEIWTRETSEPRNRCGVPPDSKPAGG